ncbi:MAG: biopolymer transporter ExbD [Holosporaceae bacterium]|jgi:biopolymer transport protein TolR|nr:biopolymer transporter ExbD [Holosporaceae bacterium]
MSFSTKKRANKSRLTPMSEMNVTPMIDVMLVLLVIFMVTAPLLTVGVKVNLPTANAPNISSNESPIIVNISGENRVFVGEVEVELETLPAKLKAITKENPVDTKIFVRGDQRLSYGKIMEVMGKISDSGFKKVVLVTELPKKRG